MSIPSFFAIFQSSTNDSSFLINNHIIFYHQMKEEPLPYTPQYGFHGNVIQNITTNTTKGQQMTKVIECSDIVYSEFEGYTPKLKSIRVEQIQLLRKDLDQPLSFIKSFFAKVASIKEEHQFIILKTQHFYVSIDYYINNRLVVRMGEQAFVFDYNKSQARRKASILKEQSGLEWRRVIRKEEELTLGNVLDTLIQMKMKNFSQISYNGSHFSREIFNLIQHTLIIQKS